MLTNTEIICLVVAHDANREDGSRNVDIGNYFETPDGSLCVITTKKLAKRYGYLVDVPIYVRGDNVTLREES